MEEQVTRLVDKAWNRLLQTPPDRRLIIAVGGIPGSGKTTLSQTVVAALNARHFAAQAATTTSASSSSSSVSKDPIAAFVPMDGFHLTRAQLSQMPDPAHAFARRGAEFTFDGAGFVALVRALSSPIPIPSTNPNPDPNPENGIIVAPAFDHATKDPVEGAIRVSPGQRVVVLEGNYVLLDRDPWRDAASFFDERWFVRVDPAVARRRLVRRHVDAGIAADEAEADRRVVENDLPNGEEIVRFRLPEVDEEVESREDWGWAAGVVEAKVLEKEAR